jgi:hypothetical protein
MTFNMLKEIIGERRQDYKIVFKAVEGGITTVSVNDKTKELEICVSYTSKENIGLY